MTTFIQTQTAEELQFLLGEAWAGVPRSVTDLTESEVDGLFHSFSNRPAHLNQFASRLIADELAQLERVRQRANHGNPAEF